MNVIEKKIKELDERVSELSKLVEDVSSINEVHGSEKALFYYFGHARSEIDRMKSDASEFRKALEVIDESKARAVTPDE